MNGATLTLTYNETLGVSATPSSLAFTVNVNGQERSIIVVGLAGAKVLLTLSTAVESGDTVTVAYAKPSGTNVIKDTQGREADSFTGQAVANNTAASSVERSDPVQAPGSLEVVRHESGKLLASWTAPESGPSPTGYTLQWKESGTGWDDADDVSEAGVKVTSHVITGLTDGTEYAVRVISTTDNAESSPSDEVLATPQETVPPAPSAASVDGAALSITFGEPLDAGKTPDKSAFSVAVAGSSRGVAAVAVSGSVATITLVTAVIAGDTVTVDYTAPAGEADARLQDLAGNAAASFSGQAVANNTQAADPLTASTLDVPESHDGSSTFTFELRFSESPRKGFSYKIMRYHAFTATGGDVTKTRRLEQKKNIRWEIHVTPSWNEAVTIVLPPTTDCTAEGAICTQDRRPLSSTLEIVIPGPGRATGKPGITGAAQVDQLVTAITSGIQDTDGLENAAFQFQWLADNTEITGATGSTYTPASGDVGKSIKVRVDFTDDAGHAESLTSHPTGAVAAAGLELQSATVDGSTLTLTYNEVLDTGVSPPLTAFTVNVNGASRSLSVVSVADSAVTLTLSTAVEADDTVTVDYVAPDGPDSVRDTQGKKAAWFRGQPAFAPLTDSAHDVPESHDGSSAFTFEVRFSETLKDDFTDETLRDHAFTVTGGEVVNARLLEPPGNARWEISVRPDGDGPATIVLPATTDCEAYGAICTEDGRMLSTRLEITVPGPGG